ncbi:rhodanese-like domain-containing protein [Lacticaseibacillus jixiensis]|uniref:rhodanese-like domain-containing protein n=1 Tax=Lacticaseibacillus jixiensis TaxID=3231926 RepID=UPI0036F27F05
MFGFQPIRSITPDQLPALLHTPHHQLIDVREPSEFRSGHISGAKNVPLARISQYTPPSNTKLYVICHSGARSKRAYKQLHKRGIDVTNVAGGMLAWSGRTVS